MTYGPHTHMRAHTHYDIRASLVAQVVKYPPGDAAAAGDVGSIPGSGRSPGGGNGKPLQNSCLENPMDRGAMDRGAWHGVTNSQTRLSTHSCTHTRAHTHGLPWWFSW